MSRTTSIHYDPAKLKEQYPAIAESQQNALKKIIDDAYVRTTELNLDDPHELLRFALTRLEPLSDSEPYMQLRASLKNLTLRESVLSLAKRIEDDAALAKHLATLLKIFERGPLTKSDYDFNRADQDPSVRLLVEHWIQDPARKNFLWESLCFCSDLAMAKLVYAKTKGMELPPRLLTKEPERIRKLYGRLGLIPARPRIIKDVDLKGGKVRWVCFKNALGRRS